MYPIQSSLHCNLRIEQIFPGIRNWNFYLIHKFYDLQISYLRAAFVPLSILQLVGGSKLASRHALKNNENGSYFYELVNLVSAAVLLYFILGFQGFCCTLEWFITAHTGRSGILQG